MTLLPIILSMVFGALILLSLVRDWHTYRKLQRSGQMTRQGLTGNLSADVLGVLLGLGVAWGSNRLLAAWFSRHSWAIPEWALILLPVGLTLLVVVMAGTLYSRYADGRVRRFLLSDTQDGEIE